MSSVTRDTQTASRLSVLRQLSPLGKVLVAVGAYVVWTVVTWLLEGRIQTLLRPEATADRVMYTGVANVLVGTILALVLVREFVASDFTSRERLGLQSPGRTLGAVLVAAVFGIAVYLLQQPPSMNPVVVANTFAQVLPVSIAEIVVCWVVVGGSVAALLSARGTNTTLANGIALVAASVVFGVYHLAHSPPFNTPAMITLLTIVSVGTGLFYFVGKSLYGALVFHNFLALVGVTTALADAGQLPAYETPLVPLLTTALVALLVLVGVERWLVRDATATATTASRSTEGTS